MEKCNEPMLETVGGLKPKRSKALRRGANCTMRCSAWARCGVRRAGLSVVVLAHHLAEMGEVLHDGSRGI